MPRITSADQMFHVERRSASPESAQPVVRALVRPAGGIEQLGRPPLVSVLVRRRLADQRDPARCAQRRSRTCELRRRGKASGRHDVELAARSGHGTDVAGHHVRALLDAEGTNGTVQQVGSARPPLDQRQPDIGPSDGDHQAGQATPRSEAGDCGINWDEGYEPRGMGDRGRE